MGSARRAAAGGRRPADRRRRRYKTGHSGRHRTAKSGERRRLVCDSARYKGAETAVSHFFASAPWGLFKSIWCFFCVVLGRQGSRPCGYFHAEMRGSRRTAKSDRSKAALALVSGRGGAETRETPAAARHVRKKKSKIARSLRLVSLAPRHEIWDDGYPSKGVEVRHKAVARLPMTRQGTCSLDIQRQRPVRPDHRGRAVVFGASCACGRRSRHLTGEQQPRCGEVSYP